jgi:hypothetical protein
MSTTRRWAIAAGGTAVLIAATVTGLTLHQDGARIGQQAAQIGGQAAQIHRLDTRLSVLAGKTAGPNHDVITCRDWHTYSGGQVTGTDSAGGQISAWADPATLPPHCLNG